MMHGARNVVSNIIFVIKKPKYFILTVLLALFLFSLFIFLNNISLFASAFGITQDIGTLAKVFLNAVDMIRDIGGIPVFSSVIAVSVLGGLSVSMIVYKIAAARNLGSGQSLLSFGGVFGGALSSSCAACSSALISVLGVSGGLAVFPFRGLELSSLSIAILSVSIYFVSKSLSESGECRINRKIVKY